MSHHFDTPTAKEDPRINVCDFYLFRGRPGTTVMALTVNPNAGVGAPDTFRDEGLYAFRFDKNRDLREDVAFKVLPVVWRRCGGRLPFSFKEKTANFQPRLVMVSSFLQDQPRQSAS